MVKGKAVWTSAAARRLMSLAGNPPTIKDAVRIVAHWVLDGIPCPPTDLEAIKPRLEISGFFPEDLSVSGELRREVTGFKIVYSSHLSPERRRFTIAHELGHAIFQASGPNCPRTGVELEKLCDLLATEILMPRGVFLTFLGAKSSLQRIFELAKLFRTSLAATAIRCSELRGTSVFEIDNGAVLWSRGVVKRVESEIREAVGEALAGNPVNEVVYLNNKVWTGGWRLEGVPIGRGSRALFLLYPLRPVLDTST